MRVRLLFVALATCWMVLAPSAMAEIRTATLTDPVDEPASGADVTSLQAEFDDQTGHLVLTTTFAAALPDPVPAGDRSLSVTLATGSGYTSSPSCSATSGKAPTVSADLRTATASYRLATGFTEATPSRDAGAALSSDRKTFVVTIDDPELKGVELDCITGSSTWTTDYFDFLASRWFDGFPRVPPGPPFSAATRGGIATDPRDVEPVLEGNAAPDIRDGRAIYDPVSGLFELVIRFYEPYDPYGGTAFITEPGFYVGGIHVNGERGSGYRCGDTPAGLSTSTRHPGLSVDGYEDTLGYEQYFNSDFTEMTMRASSPALANRDYGCAAFGLMRWRLSTPGDPASRYSSGCDCWLRNIPGDDIETIFFIGAIPPACADNLDNDKDKRVDLKDPGCIGQKTDADETDPAPVPSTLQVKTTVTPSCALKAQPLVGPALTPKAVFPFAPTRFTLRGTSKTVHRYERTRTTRGSATFRSLRAGRYQLKLSYASDPFRGPSAATKKVRVPRRCR